MKNNKVLIPLVFVLTFGVGFGLSFIVKNVKKEDVVSAGSTSGTTANVSKDNLPKENPVREQIKPVEQPEVIDVPALQENISQVVLSASKPVLSGDTYSFTASCEGVISGVAYHYELWSKKLVQKSNNGYFKGVPANESGTYKLCLVDDKTGQNMVDPIQVRGFKQTESSNPKQGISADEFQRRMLNKSDRSLDGGRNSLVSRSLRISIVGMHSDEENRPTDIQGIRDKIDFGIWSSAQVVGELTYDSKGLVTGVTIKPVY